MESTFHEDIFFVLFGFLTNKEMLTLRRTSKFFCHTTTKDRFWESRALEKIRERSVRYMTDGKRKDYYISEDPLGWIRQHISYKSFFELWTTLRFVQEFISSDGLSCLENKTLWNVDLECSDRNKDYYTRLCDMDTVIFADDGASLSDNTGVWLQSLTSLTSLSFNDCEFETVPKYVSTLTNLKTLGLTGCKNITTIPFLPALEELYLGRCEKMSHLPVCVKDMSFLECLHISYSGIEALPSFLFSLTNLQRLGMSETKISVLPPEIGNLTNLKSLDFSGTMISKIPEQIVALTQLDHLSLCDLVLYDVSQDVLTFMGMLPVPGASMYRTKFL